MGRIKEIAEATDGEIESYLAHVGWDRNPFAHAATIDEYVLPGEEEIADIATHIRSYTGPLLIHSRYSGAGKTTLLKMLLEEYSDGHQTAYIGEHNVTPFELVAIVADQIGVGKSTSTKLTEQKIRDYLAEHDGDPYLIGIDEFGLNDPDTLHVVQFLNDLEGVKITLTGMSSQWDAIGQLGSDGRAFQRRVAYQLQLEPFDRDQTRELIARRVTLEQRGRLEDDDLTAGPFTPNAIDTIHEHSKGIPAVATAACAELVGLAAYQFANDRGYEITADLADAVDYAEPEVESASD
jgi:type II secretory pathway predicted ATPase ExeA